MRVEIQRYARYLVICLIVSLFLCGCVVRLGKSVSGRVVTVTGPILVETRTVPRYTGIRSEAAMDIIYAESDRIALEVVAPSDILPLIATDVIDGMLVLRTYVPVSTHDRIRVIASGPPLSSVINLGAGDIVLSEMSNPHFMLKIFGSGNATLSGQVETVGIDISGAGNVDASALYSRRICIDISGAANVQAHASEQADVFLNGAADIDVYGNPVRRQVQQKGAGTVRFW